MANTETLEGIPLPDVVNVERGVIVGGDLRDPAPEEWLCHTS